MDRGRSPAPACRFARLIEASLDQRLADAEREALARHQAEVPECPGCRAERAALARVSAALAAARQAPPPPLDRQAVWARLEPELGRPQGRPAWVAWAAAAAAACLALALAWIGWPRDPGPAPAPRPAPVLWPLEELQGHATGLFSRPGGGPPALQEGIEVRLEADAGLAVRPAPGLHLSARDGAALALSTRAGGGLRLALRRGSTALHLRSSIPSLVVALPHGAAEARGTAFLVSVQDSGEAEIALLEGRLWLTTALGTGALIEGPCELSLGREGLGPCGPLVAASQGRLADALAAPAREDARIAWLGYYQPPVPRATPPAPERPAAAGGQDALARARKLLAARRVPEALGVLDEHLAAHPLDAHGRLLRADALRLGGDSAAAREAYLQVAREAPGAAEREAALFQAGLLALRGLRSPERALRDFDELRRLFPRGLLRQEVAFHLAECYLALEDFRRARRALADYLRLYPQGTQAQAARAWLDELEAKGWR